MLRITFLLFGLILCAAGAMPLTAQSAPQLTGTLKSVQVVPNRPGARCGNHYDLSVATADGKVVVVTVYDMSASTKGIYAMQGKQVEINLAGSVVMGIRVAGGQNTEIAALSGLSTRIPC
jgi:hypothetical protein